MSLSLEPGKGIRVPLGEYSPIRSSQFSGRFWDPDFQAAIRQGRLADFLPHGSEENGQVAYVQMIAGREALSESTAPTSLAEVPPSELEALRSALTALLAEAASPDCDAGRRRIIEAFRLPDPTRDPELYRLSGTGADRRLLILWGVEKQAGSALLPTQALPRIAGSPPLPPAVTGRATGTGAPVTGRQWWAVGVAALSALLLLTAGGWYVSRHPSRTTERRSSVQAASPPAAASPTAAPPGIATATPPPVPSKPLDLRASTPGPSGSSAPAIATATPGLRVTPPPGPTAPAATVAPRPLAGTDELYSAPPGTMNSSEDAIPTPPVTTRPRITPPTPSSLPPVPTTTPSATAGFSPSPAAPLSPGFEIASATAASTPMNGKMDVVLNASAHDTRGNAAAQPRITAWRIDGVVQNGVDGQPFTGPSLPASLTRGTHRVTLSGTMPDGSRAAAEAEVNVRVRLREEGIVEVTPVRH